MSETLQAVLGPVPLAAGAAAFLKVNLASGAAILAVVSLRGPALRHFGAALAYRLWLAPPILALLLVVAELLRNGPDPLGLSLARHPALLHTALVAWGVGAVVTAAAFCLSQARFHAELRSGRAGPAVIGFFAPRIVFPSDNGAYSETERELIRAHEREHVARKDTRAITVAAVAQCVCWFNPLIHVAAALLRLDQEFACDAAVILRRPGARRLYANTLLKSQMASRAGPVACCWLAIGAHPLELRIAQLKRSRRASLEAAVHPAADAIRP